MKGMAFGVVGIGGVGAAAVMGGGSGPNDFIGNVSRPPEVVYAAFSQIAPAGELSLPSKDGWGARFKQRIVKVANEKVKLEVLIDDAPLITAEVQFAPGENNGTRVAAELDFDADVLNKIIEEQGAPPIPGFAFQEFLIDQVFAQAMGEMVSHIESGKPLLSLAATHERWGGGDSPRRAVATYRTETMIRQHGAARPQMSARPQLDPSDAATSARPTRGAGTDAG